MHQLLLQVFLQPFMAFCEISAYRAAPQLRREWIVAMPCGFGKVAISPYRLLSRTITVCFTTFLVSQPQLSVTYS